MIEVILKEHVEHLGERGDVVKVAPGYARNYLLPRKLALAVTTGNKKQIEHEKKAAAAKAAEERAVAQALATRFAQTEVSFTRRASDTSQLFGSVTSADIAEALDRAEAEVGLGGVRTVIGLAGSVTTVTAQALGLTSYDRSAIHLADVSIDEMTEACERLIEQANAAGGTDNITCVLARYRAQ